MSLLLPFLEEKEEEEEVEEEANEEEEEEGKEEEEDVHLGMRVSMDTTWIGSMRWA